MVDFIEFTTIAAPKIWIGGQMIDTIAIPHHAWNRS
jgi:hypothetical protein